MSAFNHRQGSSLTVDGADIYYEQVGQEHDHVLVLLHGGLGTLEDFNPLVPALARSFRLVALDSRGHGKSTLGRLPCSYARLEADVVAVTQHLNLRRFSVVGFSDGGTVGLRLASTLRDRIEKLVVVGATYELTESDPLRERLLAVTPESWKAKFPETVAAYERLNPAPDFAALVRAVLPMWVDLSPDGQPGASIKNIHCPTMVVRGDEDPLVSRAVAFDLAQQLSNARLLNLPFAAHEVHKDQAEVVGPLLVRFLREQKHG